MNISDIINGIDIFVIIFNFYSIIKMIVQKYFIDKNTNKSWILFAFHKNIDKKYKKLYSENIKFLTFFGNFKEVAYESL